MIGKRGSQYLSILFEIIKNFNKSRSSYYKLTHPTLNNKYLFDLFFCGEKEKIKMQKKENVADYDFSKTYNLIFSYVLN